MSINERKMTSKLYQQYTTTQLLILTTVLTLAHANFLPFPTTEPVIQTKLNPKPNGPANAFKTCYNDKCQCKKGLKNCYLSDRSGGVSLDIAWDYNQDKITISCEGTPKNIDELLEQVPHKFKYQETFFKLRNCLQLPAILKRQNVTFVGNIEYDTQMQVPEDLFYESKGLVRLIFNITTDNMEYVVSPQLFHTLSHLIELELIIVCNVDAISLPLDLFHGLYGLQRLSLYVYHTEMGYYELTNSQRTSAQNLTNEHFGELGALKSLLLDANQLRTLNGTMLQALTELNHLGLSLNELRELPGNLLATQHKLVVLDLSLNALTYLPDGLFDNTPLLWKLLLSENQLHTPTNIIASIRSLHYLYALDLSKNQFTTIWGSGNYSRENLLRRHNIRDPLEVLGFVDFIRSGRGALKVQHINRTTINLRKNHIARFNLDWIIDGVGLACPYELNLFDNNIANIYAATQPPSTTRQCRRSLILQYNPLHCDCRLAWVYSSNLLGRTERWTCAEPAHLRNRLLNSLQRTDLCPWSPAFCPERCRCSYDTPLLVVNCTGAHLEVITQLPRPEQFALTQTVLHLEHNNFYELPANTTFGYANVTRIYATHNRLAAILESHIPNNLSLLDVRNNQLERLSVGFLLKYLNESQTLKQLYLSSNPWLCDCDAEQLLYTVRAQRERIPDASELRCANLPNAALLNVSYAEVCKAPFLFASSLLLPIITIFTTAVCILSIIALYYKYKLEVKIWLFSHDMFLCCVNEMELDKDKTFDAFISYAHQDQAYVNEVLLPGLETGRSPFRICTHERNWLAGTFIPEQIVESVEQSRRTIIVLSQHFVASDWGRMEFRTAHQCALNEGRARIIIIKYGELSNLECLDTELQAYLKLNTYLEWNDPRFWNKLRYGMPHKYGEGRKSGMLQLNRGMGEFRANGD